MDQQRIKELIDLLAESDLSEMTLSEDGATLTLTRHSTQSASVLLKPPAVAATPTFVAPSKTPVPVKAIEASVVAQSTAAASEVCSPLYGILHLTPSPEEPSFAAVGDSVAQGQTLCIVEAMKMFHQVKATKAGRIDAILAVAGNEVESGQPLFRIV